MDIFLKNSCLLLIIFCLSMNAHADPVDAAAAITQAEAVKQNPPKPRSAEAMMKRDGSPEQNCSRTSSVAVQECLQPTGQGFKQVAMMLTTLPSIATAFMAGGDPEKMARMCKLSQAMLIAGGLLNGGQDKTCQNATVACQTVCGESVEQLKEIYEQAPDDLALKKIQMQIDGIRETEEKCLTKVTEQMQLAQQQQQANQSPIAGAENCEQVLNEDPDGEDSNVDCSLAEYANTTQCTTIAETLDKTGDGGVIPFESGATISKDDSLDDLPEAQDDREDFWNDLKNKAANGGGNGSRGGAGAGAFGGGSGGGSGNGSGNRAGGGAARKAGSTMVSGGNESSSGAGGWGKGSDDDFNKKFAKLDAKKKGLNMLTKKKIGGRGIASSEFGLASDDIWTRVYLRTNTRCTKQLAECAANKSQNPYGVVNKSR